jgi:hypothetical protein
MSSRNDHQKHLDLIVELMEVFQKEGFSILEAAGVDGYPVPVPLENDGYGDQEDKEPDIYAYDPKRNVHIIGEVKTGDGDFETEHALTQYNVFLDQVDRRTGKRALLYVMVPSEKVSEFSAFITHYLHREYWGMITLVSSQRWKE